MQGIYCCCSWVYKTTDKIRACSNPASYIFRGTSDDFSVSQSTSVVSRKPLRIPTIERCGVSGFQEIFDGCWDTISLNIIRKLVKGNVQDKQDYNGEKCPSTFAFPFKPRCNLKFRLRRAYSLMLNGAEWRGQPRGDCECKISKLFALLRPDINFNWQHRVHLKKILHQEL